MSRAAGVVGWIVALGLFAGLAYAIAPFSPTPKTVLVPGVAQLDAMQSTLLIADGMDRVGKHPLSYYDMSILYPDHNQRRSLEPFLAPVIVGLPLRLAFRMPDVNVFQWLRWILSFAGLVYAFLLLRALHVDIAISIAGAAVCVAQPMLLDGIERLQFLSVPLLLGLVYHAVMLWRGASPRAHGVGLFVTATLWPMFSLVNAIATVAGLVFIAPLLWRALATARRKGRLAAVAVPLGLAVVVEAILLAPWLRDRSDMAIYSSAAFLRIKHWNPLDVPANWPQVSDALSRQVGWPLIALGIVATALVVWAPRGSAGPTKNAPLSLWRFIWIPPLVGLVVAPLWQHGVNPAVLRAATLLFQAACFVSVLACWRVQFLLSVGTETSDLRRILVTAGASAGVALCLLAFGPVYEGNANPLATTLTRVLITVIPPLASIREFYRIWMSGVLFLSLALVITIGWRLRSASQATRLVVAAILVSAVGWSIADRPLSATTEIEAPSEITSLAAHSLSRGGVYVHPLMRWDSQSCVLMIAAARQLRRPMVNGCLGLIPPWFPYATNVLQRFPDPEALWLLREWRIETVLDLETNRKTQALPFVSEVFSGTEGRVWEVEPPVGDAPHPSIASSPGAADLAHIDAKWTSGDGRIDITVPPGVFVEAVQVEFAMDQLAVNHIPSAIDVYNADGSDHQRLNAGHSGEWIESLAANALIHRQAPVAMVRLQQPSSTSLVLKFPGSHVIPLQRIVLVGRRVNAEPSRR